MNVFFSSDNNYAQHLGVAITSLLTNARIVDHLQLYVLDGGISDFHKKRVETLKKIRPFEIEYIKQNPENFEICPIAGCPYISTAAYYRLIIPSLKAELDRAIYIDVDTVILTSLNELWESDLEGCHTGAVEDCGAMISRSDIPERLGTTRYFNSGMMLLDLKKWREDRIEEKCFDFIKNHADKICWVDQDVVNHVLSGKVQFLLPKWNLQTSVFTFGKFSLYDLESINTAKSNPAIIHYLAPNRPWKQNCNFGLKSEYLKYLARYDRVSYLKIYCLQKTWPLRSLIKSTWRRVYNKAKRIASRFKEDS